MNILHVHMKETDREQRKDTDKEQTKKKLRHEDERKKKMAIKKREHLRKRMGNCVGKKAV